MASCLAGVLLLAITGCEGMFAAGEAPGSATASGSGKSNGAWLASGLIVGALLAGGWWLTAGRVARLTEANRRLRLELEEGSRAAQTLRESEERYRLLFDSNPHPMWVFDLETLAFLQVNEAAILHYGYSRDEFLAMTIKEIRPPEELPVVLQSIASLSSRLDHAGVRRHLKKDGTVIDVDIISHGLEVDGRSARLVLACDITERRRAEAALKASDERFRALFELAPDAIYLVDPQGTIKDGNRAAQELVGIKKEELIGKNLFEVELLPPEEARRAAESLAHTAQGHPSGPQEYVLHHRDGSAVFVEIRSFPLTIQDQPLILGIARDIRERKKLDEQIRKLSQAVEQSPASIVITDPAGNIQYVNPSFCSLSGYEPRELLGQNPRLLKSGLTPPERFQEMWNTLKKGREWRGELINRKKNGEVFCELAVISPLRGPDGSVTHYVAVKDDITRRKSLEKQLLRSQRLESIGTLAAGMAHDLNNIFTPIVLSAHLLNEDALSEDESRLVRTIQASAQRGAEIVRQVLTFARGTEGERVALEPAHLLDDVRKIIHETFPKNIQTSFQVPAGLWHLTGDATQLHQVLINLCLNARDAMPAGGTLEIAARNVHASKGAGLFADSAGGPCVMIQVTDSGQGMAPALLDKIFEPFFTTKAPGTGTGLGLSTVLGIVRSHGGFVDVRSAVDQGSTFEVCLPARSEAPAFPKKAEPELLIKGTGECVLFVDDEAPIRSVLHRALKLHGYDVLLASDGQEALELWSQHADRIQLVVTDIIMPGFDGVALIRELKEASPNLPIIACTGWGHDGLRAKLAPLGVRSILEKPYLAEELLALLHEHLTALSPANSR